ncbi:hypothetical protein BGZ70_009877 [Mortierella alpina]|uniref:F-box domain-containing protein n=1 Tax=Mortierella alpina TaxID=64518 RepID=A0A9P6M001_MORAP|nr:hypothetical protein BGZ70_009877 [Mortierella alpina]
MDSLPQELLCILLGYLQVLDAFRVAGVCKHLRSASMNLVDARLADFTSLPATVKDRFRTSVISPDNMKILKRYQAIDLSRTGVTAEDVVSLIRCGITVITIHQCFNIDQRSLLSGLRDYGAENPDVFVSLHTARSHIGMWLNLRSDLMPYSGNICIYDDNTQSKV